MKYNSLYKKISILFSCLILLSACNSSKLADLKVSENGRFIATKDGKPFFWLGDTGWLLFNKLTREETETYLEDRKQKGFNVIQVMVLHTTEAVNAYGDSALVKRDVANPKLTEGNNFTNEEEYDFWDHVDFVIKKAEEKGIYMALVPIWGGNVKAGHVSQKQAEIYASFLANRYKNQSNIIWLNGGDIKGSDSLAVWKTIGKTINDIDTKHLITFHPRGRTSSSDWFHNENWLDFNMVQSGHKSYEQDTSANETRHFGEDNWKFINDDYRMNPIKPTIDGEPSYEGIPHGLHDSLATRWTADDVRRYGYWSVFAGAFGYTYGQNEVMQMHKGYSSSTSFGPIEKWSVGIKALGSTQMIHLKNLMLSKPFFDLVPDQSLVLDQGSRYDYLIATKAKNTALIYTYTGRNFKVNMGKIAGEQVKASWYSPRDGKTLEIGVFDNKGEQAFNPPAEPKNGNDWVLILDSK